MSRREAVLSAGPGHTAGRELVFCRWAWAGSRRSCRRERPLMRSTAGCAGPGYDGGGAALGRPSAGMGQEMVPEGLKLVPDGALHCMVHGVQLPSDALWNSSCAESPVSRPNVTVPGLLGAV